jgi:hypothetical protein
VLRFGVYVGLLSFGLLSVECLLPGIATVVYAVWRDELWLHSRLLHSADATLLDDVCVHVSRDGNDDGTAGLRDANATSIDDASAPGAGKS